MRYFTIQKYIEYRLFSVTFQYYMIQMVAFIRDTHLLSISKVS